MEMQINNLPEPPVTQTFEYTVGGEKGKYKVSFLIDGDHLKVSCTCGSKMPCSHVEYILAGRTTRIASGDIQSQGTLMTLAEETIEGSKLMRKAKTKYAGETHCRRCSSDRIVKIKSSITARVFTLFKDTANHSYYCKNCKWTW